MYYILQAVFLLCSLFIDLIVPALSFPTSQSRCSYTTSFLRNSFGNVPALKSEEVYDSIVIGSGLAGLTCAALLAKAGQKVIVLESHDTPGGCAHGWIRQGFHFESGPSLYSGFSADESSNPLKNVFQILEEEPEWLTYDRWGTVLPEGKFAAKIGASEIGDVLLKYGGGKAALDDWNKLTTEMLKPGGVSDAAQAISPLALREDFKVVVTLARYWRKLGTVLKNGKLLNEPVSRTIERLDIRSEFVKNWFNMLCFLLQGLPLEGTMTAVIGYMLYDWYSPDVTLDFPKGGSAAIVDALVRGLTKNGGVLRINSEVSEVLVEGGEATGVRLKKTGTVLRAKKAVVSNVDLAGTRALVSRGLNNKFDELIDGLMNGTPLLKSFIHLHAGIDAKDLPRMPSEALPAQWAVVNDWDVEAPRNLVLVSAPSLIDSNLSPEGTHVIHAYTPATEPYENWSNLARNSSEYKRKKEEAASFLWDAVETYIPGARGRSIKSVEQIGTPLTHERFLRRSRGSYGPRIFAGTDKTLPNHKTPLKKFYMCGDYTFPGIGVPAAAASGCVTANTILPLTTQLKFLEMIKLRDQ